MLKVLIVSRGRGIRRVGVLCCIGHRGGVTGVRGCDIGGRIRGGFHLIRRRRVRVSVVVKVMMEGVAKCPHWSVGIQERNWGGVRGAMKGRVG